jgi:hypothetical protein
VNENGTPSSLDSPSIDQLAIEMETGQAIQIIPEPSGALLSSLGLRIGTWNRRRIL